MASEFWGVFDLGRQAFASRSINHSGEYIGVILHHSSRATVESWLGDRPDSYYGNRAEVRLIGLEYANRMHDCVCLEHRAQNKSNTKTV